MAHGYGKTILFGEHVVVYGLPAIVSAINHTLEVKIEPLSKTSEQNILLVDKSTRFPGVPPLTWERCQGPIMHVVNYLDLIHGAKIKKPFKIICHGNLPITHGGLGTSAASLVALVRALNDYFHLNLSDEEVNEAAYEGEKQIHGNPSGIDNTAATYGGMFWFERKNFSNTNSSDTNLHQNVVKPIKLQKPIEIVLIDSGRPTQTKEVIQSVSKFLESNPTKKKYLFESYTKIVHEAYQAILAHDLYKVGQLMNKNHKLLQELTVSCPELDNIVELARASGALGAKLTGTGRGGMAIALTPGEKLQNNVAKVLEDHNYPCLKTTLNIDTQ